MAKKRITTKKLAPLLAVGAVIYFATKVRAVPLELGSLSGTIIDVETGEPIDKIEVILNGLTYTTNVDGVFMFLEVELGTYELVAIDPLARYGGETMLVIIEAGKLTTATIALTPIPTTGSLQVTVLDFETGLGIEGAIVSIVGGPTGYTDANGVSLIGVILPGTYNVDVNADAYYKETI